VPAAAVRQEGQVLFHLIGRKGYVGGYKNLFLKVYFKEIGTEVKVVAKSL